MDAGGQSDPHVEIYDYIHDWNGNPITADDIIFCYEKAIELSLSGYLTSIDSIEKIDDYNIRFNLKTNYIMTIENILNAIDIVSQKEYEASADRMRTRVCRNRQIQSCGICAQLIPEAKEK